MATHVVDVWVYGAHGDGRTRAAVPFMFHQAGVSTQAPWDLPRAPLVGLTGHNSNSSDHNNYE